MVSHSDNQNKMGVDSTFEVSSLGESDRAGLKQNLITIEFDDSDVSQHSQHDDQPVQPIVLIPLDEI